MSLSSRDIKELFIYVLIDTLLVLATAYILAYLTRVKGIDVTYGLYGCSKYCYPNYFLGASATIVLLAMVVIGLVYRSRALNKMILSMLLITPVAFYTDLFTRRGVEIEILPLLIVYRGGGHSSIGIDIGQVSLIALLVYIIYTVLRRRRDLSVRQTIQSPSI